MVDIGDAFYPEVDKFLRRVVPEGRYTARITGMETSEDVVFGKYIADVFKPEYEIEKEEHPEYGSCVVKDNGIFRYKKVDNYIYEHKKNWGFAQFISIMGLRKKEDQGGQLPYLFLNNIKNATVLIDVTVKQFYNDLDSDVRYPVARTLQLIKSSPVPF